MPIIDIKKNTFNNENTQIQEIENGDEIFNNNIQNYSNLTNHAKYKITPELIIN